ncbi:MAG: hypothetical protein R2729_32420 [Bryobacteraceae bacterium]
MTRTAIALIAAALLLPAEPFGADEGAAYLDRYFEATRTQKEKTRGLAMDVDIDASIPSMKKQGRFHALRQVTRLGAITYRAITMQGDNTVKKDVIARYLQAEKEAAEKGSQSLGITPENYKFKYWGSYGEAPWRLHLFEIDPRKKQPGLFRGWIWIEDSTGLPVREQGEFVKSPSIFIRKISFTRDYEIQDGVAYLKSIESTIDTRIVGEANIAVRYSNYKPLDDAQSVSAVEGTPVADSR